MRKLYATDAQLAWFKLENYPSRAAVPHLGVQRWIDLVEDRLLIKLAFDARTAHPELAGRAMELFGHIQSAPLTCRDNKTLRYGQPHLTDTPTVSCLRVGEVLACAASAQIEGLDKNELYSFPGDRARDGYAGFHALVLVDLSARNSTLEANFRTWLKNLRQRELVEEAKPPGAKAIVANWECKHYLPYFDLDLFSTLYGVSISAKRRVCLLGLRADGNDASDDQLLETPKKSIKAFTWQMVKRLKSELGTD